MKVFGIGLNKTGTKTLRLCFEHLGFKHKSFDFQLLRQVKSHGFTVLHDCISDHNSFEDWPFPLYIKEIDAAFPGSKFILTTRRTPEIWLESLFYHSLTTDPERGMIARTLVYGYPYPQCNPKHFLDFYNHHLAWSKDYFKCRQPDFLEVCWENGDDWSTLCSFLGLSLPRENFPHANKRGQKNNDNFEKNKEIIRLYGHNADSCCNFKHLEELKESTKSIIN